MAKHSINALVWVSTLCLGAFRPAAAAEPVLFTKGVMADVRPEDAPAASQLVKKIDLIACPDEFEPFSLAIRDDRDGSWAFRSAALKGAGGRAIPASAVEIAPLRFRPAQGHLGKYGHVKDYILQPKQKGMVILKGATGWLWLTVHVPADAKPGRYEGTLTLIRKEDARRLDVPLAVEVLPVPHVPPKGVQFALLYTVAFGQYHTERTRKQRRPAALALYREMKDHGMTCIAPKCSDWDGRTSRSTGTGWRRGHYEGLEACVAAAMEVGLDGPILWNMGTLINVRKGGKNYAQFDGKCDGWNERRDLANFEAIIRETQALAKARRWPEIVYLALDEPGTQTENLKMRTLRLGELLPKTLKVTADLGVRGGATITEPVDEKHNRRWVEELDELRKLWDRSRPYCHIRLYGYGYPQGKTDLAHEQADCKKRGHEMWFYNNGASMGGNRHLARLFFGLWGWRVGARGLTSWTYPGGRTVQLELIREGIDDFKYLATLERLIAEKRGTEQDRNAAQAFLDKLKASIKLDKNGYIKDWAAAAAAATGQAKTADFAALKRRIAERIRALAN